MTNYKLLATSPTIEGIQNCIAAYWCSPPRSYLVQGEQVFSVSSGKIVQGVRVIKKAGRYRFERILEGANHD